MERYTAKKGFSLKQVRGENPVIPGGEYIMVGDTVITLNKTALFIWHFLENTATFDEIIDALTAEYEIDRETAAEDIRAILDRFILCRAVIVSD